MKRLLTITTLLFVSLLYSQSKFDINNLIDRGGLMYAPNVEKPYTGRVFDLYENGQRKFDGRYRKGLMNGKWTYYHENGQIRVQGRFINGDGSYPDDFPDSLKSIISPFNGRSGRWSFWYENGQKWVERTYKDGEQDGLSTFWYENGQKMTERIYKDDELIKETHWYEDGNEMNGKPSADSLLSQAEQLRGNRKYLDAIKKLEVLLEAFPDSPEAPDAQVLIAQIYMGYQNDFSSAVREFRKVVTNFPKSDQAHNAQFMMGYIYANHLDDKDKARTEFQRFIDLYGGEVEEYFLESANAELRALED